VWVLYDDVVRVAYHLFFVGKREANAVGYGRGGQVNGLMGAAEPGALVFTTGLHSGEVPLLIEEYAAAPEAVGDEWGEVVEASFTPSEPEVLVIDELGGVAIELGPGTYRVRYCAIGFDNEDRVVDEPPERYLMQFWPAPAAPDRIVRQTSNGAAYWHRIAQKSPVEPTSAERAEAARLEKAERERKAAEERLARKTRKWGGRLPDERLSRVSAYAKGLAGFDRDLVDEIAVAEPAAQRAMAACAARAVAVRAGIAELDWVAEALDALDGNEPPPPSFVDFDAAFRRWVAAPADAVTHGIVRSGLGEVRPEIQALQLIIAARHRDPLVAAMHTIYVAYQLGVVFRRGD
jgi:hypothetical protein